MVVLRSLALVAAMTAPGAASAHVVVQPATAPAGSYQVLRFSLGHGCGAMATSALRVEIPAGVASARPQPKPSWKLETERSGETVTAIVWRGDLPADQLEEFLIQVKLPPTAGQLAFPTIQSCGERQNRWVETATPGSARPEHPAPTLTLTPTAPPEGGHDHQH